MEKYLIGIKTNTIEEHTTINGDSIRPFQIAGNLWNYTTPWTAGRRLKHLAKKWEGNGFTVQYVYGTVKEIPTTGHEGNVAMILSDYKI